MRSLPFVALAVLLALLTAPAYAVRLPPANVRWDYQIGGAFAPGPHVAVVDRDRKATPAAGRYGICYVNAFRTQPDERAFWRRHRALVLRRDDGSPVVDSGWGEELLTPVRRTGAARSPRSSAGGSPAAPRRGTTPWSSTTWTPGTAATGCSPGRTIGASRGS